MLTCMILPIWTAFILLSWTYKELPTCISWSIWTYDYNLWCYFAASDVGLSCVCQENYRIDSIVAGVLKCAACPTGQVSAVYSVKCPQARLISEHCQNFTWRSKIITEMLPLTIFVSFHWQKFCGRWWICMQNKFCICLHLLTIPFTDQQQSGKNLI